MKPPCESMCVQSQAPRFKARRKSLEKELSSLLILAGSSVSNFFTRQRTSSAYHGRRRRKHGGVPPQGADVHGPPREASEDGQGADPQPRALEERTENRGGTLPGRQSQGRKPRGSGQGGAHLVRQRVAGPEQRQTSRHVRHRAAGQRSRLSQHPQTGLSRTKYASY